MWDSLILMVMALVVFGPRRLPEIGRQIGRLMYEIRKASNDFKFQMEDELRKVEDAERHKREQERQAALALAAPVQAGADSQVPNAGPLDTLRAGSGTPSLESQIPKWEPGAPVQDGQFPTTSPYPEEGVYPAPPPGDFHDNEPYPRIQPPTTGEPVAAERPSRMAEAREVPAKDPSDQTPAVTEHENHG